MTSVPPSGRWARERFDEVLKRWVDSENPERSLVVRVVDALGDMEDPRTGMRRVPGFDGLWFGEVPGTRHGHMQVVTWTYYIVERRRAVVAEAVSILGLPIHEP